MFLLDRFGFIRNGPVFSDSMHCGSRITEGTRNGRGAGVLQLVAEKEWLTGRIRVATGLKTTRRTQS